MTKGPCFQGPFLIVDKAKAAVTFFAKEAKNHRQSGLFCIVIEFSLYFNGKNDPKREKDLSLFFCCIPINFTIEKRVLLFELKTVLLELNASPTRCLIVAKVSRPPHKRVQNKKAHHVQQQIVLNRDVHLL